MFETTDDDLECMTEGEEYLERQQIIGTVGNMTYTISVVNILK